MKSLETSLTFFGHAKEKRHPLHAFTHLAAGTPPESAFQTGPSGMNTVVTINEKAPPITPKDTLTEAGDAYHYLSNMTGLVSAYMRKQVDEQKNPDLLFDGKLWQTTVEHIPLWNYGDLQHETFNETMSGAELSTKFLSTIIGFAVDIAASAADIAAFSGFLKGLGDNIQASKATNTKGFSVMNLSYGCKFEDKDAAGLKLVPWMKAYFIIFNEANSTVYTTSGSYQSYNYDFEYGVIEGEWQYDALKSSPTVKSNVDQLISGSQIDDVTRSQNYFGGVVGKK